MARILPGDEIAAGDVELRGLRVAGQPHVCPRCRWRDPLGQGAGPAAEVAGSPCACEIVTLASTCLLDLAKTRSEALSGDPVLGEKILAESVRILFAKQPVAVAAAAINASIVAVMLWGGVDRPRVAGWVVALAVISAARLVLWRAYGRRERHAGRADSPSRRWRTGSHGGAPHSSSSPRAGSPCASFSAS